MTTTPRTSYFQWALIELRSLARRVRLLALLGRTRSLLGAGRSAGYEARFGEALRSAIVAGDVVWDVGANLGLYTTAFSTLVGSGGQVYAFEPAPDCYAALSRLLSAVENVVLVNAALGDRSGTVAMHLASDPLGATHSIAPEQAGRGPCIQVNMDTGDDLLHARGFRVPNVLKIDVEGFEEEVLLGMSQLLDDPNCRAVFCEVHFGVLDQRGRRQAPQRIVSYLRGKGFRTRWIDASHLGAARS